MVPIIFDIIENRVSQFYQRRHITELGAAIKWLHTKGVTQKSADSKDHNCQSTIYAMKPIVQVDLDPL